LDKRFRINSAFGNTRQCFLIVGSKPCVGKPYYTVQPAVVYRASLFDIRRVCMCVVVQGASHVTVRN